MIGWVRSRRTGPTERTYEFAPLLGKVRSRTYTNVHLVAAALTGFLIGVGLGNSSTDPQAMWITLSMYVTVILVLAVGDIRKHRRTQP